MITAGFTAITEENRWRPIPGTMNAKMRTEIGWLDGLMTCPWMVPVAVVNTFFLPAVAMGFGLSSILDLSSFAVDLEPARHPRTDPILRCPPAW